MMHIMTAESCVWLTLTDIVGVFRTSANTALIKLDTGEVVICSERYATFIERLNIALLSAAGIVSETCVESQVEEERATPPIAGPAAIARNFQNSYAGSEALLRAPVDGRTRVAEAV